MAVGVPVAVKVYSGVGVQVRVVVAEGVEVAQGPKKPKSSTKIVCVPDDIPAPVVKSISMTDVLVKVDTALKSEVGIKTDCQEVVIPLGKMVPVNVTEVE